MILIIIMDPKTCITSAISGASLFFFKVFPSLFPFLVLSGIIIGYDGINIYSKILGTVLCRPLKLPSDCSFVLIVSALCGYPLGAKYTCELYDNKMISLKTAERLLNIASNPSPLFVIGAVGTSMLGSSKYGYLLLISTYLSCYIMGLILPSDKSYIHASKFMRSNHKAVNFGSILKSSIDNSASTCISICGFVTIFSVINSILKSSTLLNTALSKLSYILHAPFSALQGTLLGFIEMTNGCNEISSSLIDIRIKFIIISFLLSFSGISVIMQVYSFTYKYDFCFKKYISLKILQGSICSSLSLLLLKIANFNKATATVNFLNNTSNYANAPAIMILITAIMLLPLVIHKLTYRLFHTL